MMLGIDYEWFEWFLNTNFFILLCEVGWNLMYGWVECNLSFCFVFLILVSGILEFGFGSLTQYLLSIGLRVWEWLCGSSIR